MKKEDIVKILEEAYLYAYPLVLMDAIKDIATNTAEVTSEKAPINQIFHARTLATPETSLLRPNVDTLYSQSYLDLSKEPIILYKPATERYCTIQCFDGYSNTPYILGTESIGGNEECLYAFTGPFFKGELPEGLIKVEMPTNLNWLLIRTRSFGTDDLTQVHHIQDAMKTCPLSAYEKGGKDKSAVINYKHPQGTYNPKFNYIPLQYVMEMPLEQYFNRFNKLLAENPPAKYDTKAMERFSHVGISKDMTFSFEKLGTDIAEATNYLPTMMDDTYSSKHSHLTISNGWMFMNNKVGHFDDDYSFRAVVAFGGFANPVSMAIYPSMIMDKSGALLKGDKNYKLHFESGMLPPHGENGWWSLTAYNKPGYLIKNILNRYNISESDKQLQLNDDGSLDIYIQEESPGKELESNWLPICKEAFSLTMRIYLPDEKIFTFEYKLPELEEI